MDIDLQFDRLSVCFKRLLLPFQLRLCFIRVFLSSLGISSRHSGFFRRVKDITE